jgi:S-adenosylmethionine:tRNA ribosyltransferase-isomerase
MNPEFNIESYSYDLPADRIAQVPTDIRDKSRLFVLDSRSATMQDVNFSDILNFFQPGDLLVVNDTKVFPARLEGKKDTGGKIELFLLEYPDFQSANITGKNHSEKSGERKYSLTVTGLLKSSKRAKPGTHFTFGPSVDGELMELMNNGKTVVKLTIKIKHGKSPEEVLTRCGRVPLPPYIQRDDKDHPDDRERYQTLFARKSGAVAAPTAGLHFSEDLLFKLQERGVNVTPITLHVGYGTFAPVRVKDIRQHKIHEEYVEVSPDTAELINRTQRSGKRIWVVGTTTARTLEFAANEKGEVNAIQGWCGLYIYPGYKFKIVKSLITNFHLPGSARISILQLRGCDADCYLIGSTAGTIIE